MKTLTSSLFVEIEKFHMANYWLDFMSMVDALMMHFHAVHICNWEEYLTYLREMLPWL